MVGWIGHWNQSQESDSEKFVKTGTVGSGNRRGVSLERGKQTREGEFGVEMGYGGREEFGCEQMISSLGFKINKAPRLSPEGDTRRVHQTSHTHRHSWRPRRGCWWKPSLRESWVTWAPGAALMHV